MSQEHFSQRELRVVILGSAESGKTSLINTVLGQIGYEVGKRTLSCVRREGEVCGRKLLFIDTPGWWGNFSLTDTADFLKHKLVLSVSVCPPGPHAFLLVIASDSPFTEKNRRSVEEHLGLFGENIWERTIVVFTRGEYLKNKSIEQHIEREGDTLKGVIKNCGNRYLLYTEGHDEASKLMEEIDILVKTRNRNFVLDEKTLRDVEEKRAICQQRAKLRQEKFMEQREQLHKYRVIPSLLELRIVMMGWIYSGKTSAMNTILGKKDNAIRGKTYQPERKDDVVAGKRISIVDTPGWWRYISAEYTPEWVKAGLRQAMSLDGKAPHAILLTIPADTSFMEEQRKITEDNMKMFGDQVWRHTIVLFTSGDMMGDTSIEEHIENEGEPLQWLIEKCGNRYHVMSWYDKDKEVIELLKTIEEMLADICLFNPAPKAQETTRESNEEQEEVQQEIAVFLDKRWQGINKATEEVIRNICSRITPRGNASMNNPLEFCDSQLSSDNTSEGISTGMDTKSFTKESCSTSVTAEHRDPDLSREKFFHQMKGIGEMFEKEWGRQEIDVAERFKRLLSDLRESGSEADARDLDQTFKKVIWWMQHGCGSSGISSDIEHSVDEYI